MCVPPCLEVDSSVNRKFWHLIYRKLGSLFSSFPFSPSHECSRFLCLYVCLYLTMVVFFTVISRRVSVQLASHISSLCYQLNGIIPFGRKCLLGVRVYISFFSSGSNSEYKRVYFVSICFQIKHTLCWTSTAVPTRCEAQRNDLLLSRCCCCLFLFFSS